jgi:hypothetical protein
MMMMMVMTTMMMVMTMVMTMVMMMLMKGVVLECLLPLLSQVCMIVSVSKYEAIN